MINVKDAPVDVEEMRMWAMGYRERTDPALSWPQFANECGIPAGTLQPFCMGTYGAKDGGSNIARKMLQFKQQVEAASKHLESLPRNPGYFETETSAEIEQLLIIAHSGRITAGGYGPGTGKTMTAQEYADRAQPCFIATMRPTSSKLTNMIQEVHRALGLEVRRMYAADASRVVIDRLKKRKALLIIDEANHLSIDSIEEIRSWHDETGVGICLLGNQELIRRIRSGKHKEQFARLNSRIALDLTKDVPTEGDVRIFCDAWGIEDHSIRHYLKGIATSRDAGGLRECRQLIEIASAFAAQDNRGLILDDLRDVQANRSTKWIRA